MIPENFDPIQTGIVLSGGILALAAVIALYRVVFGPTPADRVIAVDLLTMLLVGLVVVVAVTHGVFAILDVALAVAILAFLATIGFARYLLRSHLTDPGAARRTG
ncbi:monovalent cation/H+ antiporter complex subunit F [Thalassobaculum sp.]|uniref:monovalent cation/H+ antiporter complex subunit F n=1 Tax=Thalassobaculum sp. TaxID=2022740 RepID=UPI003B5C4743